MRPRPDAAENAYLGVERGRSRIGFNEAAARCRGKLVRVEQEVEKWKSLQ